MIGLAGGPALAQPAPLVSVSGGLVAGHRTEDGGALFRGVPFAAPPVGDLRWRPPQPVAPWPGVRLATERAPSCPQTAYGEWNAKDAARGREDCLYLDIRTPRLDPKARAPVMVWIHGGGNRAGSAGDAVLSGLARRGVVLVAIQYRLAALGFLSHPALTAESPAHASGNYGLMDQVAALRWVHDNIARFGGDPANVTLVGESAGAQDVGLLMLAPSAHGLFAKAIEESGTAGFGLPPHTLKQNEAVGEIVTHRAGAPDHASAAALRALPVEALLKAPEQAQVPGLADASFIWLQATADGKALPQTPPEILEAARQSPIPLIIGVNARELPRYENDPTAGVKLIFGAHAPQALKAYDLQDGRTPTPDPRLGDIATQIADDATFRCPTVRVAASQVRAGAPVWVYQYDRTPDHGVVSHGSEIVSVFDNRPVSPPDAKPTYALQDYWVAFARTGNPDAPGLAAWPRQTLAATLYLQFSDAGPRVGANLRGAICPLLHSF
jgi:para-nitrobenzyl esterase